MYDVSLKINALSFHYNQRQARSKVVYQEKKVFPGGASDAGLGSPIRGSMAGSGFLGLTDRELALEMVGYL